MDHYRIINPKSTRDISPDVIDADGRLRILPAAYWWTTTPDERALLAHRHGLYGLPTIELVERLRALIDGRSAIEIGAGSGVLAEALGIPATDNRMQEREPYRSVYAQIGQAIVKYGPNIEPLDAAQAVRQYRPAVVIGSWVTHKYDPARHWAGGNEIGVDEDDILAHCQLYIVIGNSHVHRDKKIWGRSHHIEYPTYVYSRATNGTPDFIATWQGSITDVPR